MNTDIALHTLAGPDDRTARLLDLMADTPVVCAYDPNCGCINETRHMLYYAHQGEKAADSEPLMLTRDGVADVMVDLFANPTVDRIWIKNNPDRAEFLWWCPVPVASRIGQWVVDFEGHSYCFQWEDGSETVHCNTLGEWFGPIDCFSQRRWSSHRAAVMWTLDNIQHIACRS